MRDHPRYAAAITDSKTPNPRRMQGVIALLARDPHPPGAKAMQGRPALRVRTSDCRIFYPVEDDVLLIVVVRIDHRSDVHDGTE